MRTRTRRGPLCATVAAALLAASVTAAPQQPDRSAPPAPGPPPALDLPPIRKHALSNGLPVWIVEMREVPVVAATLIIRSGAAADPAGRFGTAHFTAGMLDEGAGSRSALDLADAIDFLGATLRTSSSYDASIVTLQTLSGKLGEALAIFGDVVLRPTFPEAEIERLRQERLTTLLQLQDNPSALASSAFDRLVYGAGHRYGTVLTGTEAVNASLSRDELVAFYSAHYRPGNAHLLVVGDVATGELLALLEQTFGAWTGGAPPSPPALPGPATPPAQRVYLLDKPGAAQSEIRIGGVGAARDTPDYYALDVMNTILGGAFSSRLNLNLRETHGYTYGAWSSLEMRRAAGPFTASAAVQTDKTVEALREFFGELEGMHAPPPAAELARARNLQALSLPGTFETTSNMAARLAELVVYGLPESFFEDFVPRIQGVTAADVARVAAQYLPADRFVVVVVGDLATIEAPVRAAGFGPVEVVTAADVLK